MRRSSSHSQQCQLLGCARLIAATVTIVDNEPTVTITAADANATEGADTGTFVFTRVGNTAGNLVVNFTKTGTATNGTRLHEHCQLGHDPQRSGHRHGYVTATDDATVEGNETVILTVSLQCELLRRYTQ